MFTKIKELIKLLLTFRKEKEILPIPVYVDKDHILDNKIALITGGSSGIGYAIAKKFTADGCKVILSGRNEQKLKECCNCLQNAKYIVLDIQDTNSIDAAIKQALSLCEEKRIDILVNSAGIHNQSDFWHMTDEEYSNIMDTNVKGTFFVSQAVSRYMVENKVKGHILNISSASALRPAKGPYQMSKWSIRALTLGLADILLPYGIIVNAIAPGPVATSMLGKKEGDNIYNPYNPSGRYAVPDEIANLAAFMVSDMGNLIVGDTFYMTGGSGTISYHH